MGQTAQFEVGLIHDQLTATPALAGLSIEGDFEDPAIVRVHIPAGQTRFEFSVILHDDDVREEDETFQLELGSSYDDSFKTIGPADRALATIADNDRIPPTEVLLSLTHNGRTPGIGARGRQRAGHHDYCVFPPDPLAGGCFRCPPALGRPA